MKITTDRGKTFSEVPQVKIIIGEKEFRISVNKFDELVINKSYDDSSLYITPSVSNEIRIS